MSNNKQSSVEWLIDRIKNQHLYSFVPLDQLEKQAKAMHKDETLKLIDDYEAYLDYLFKNQGGGQAVVKTFEQYYNETFNTKEK